MPHMDMNGCGWGMNGVLQSARVHAQKSKPQGPSNSSQCAPESTTGAKGKQNPKQTPKQSEVQAYAACTATRAMLS
jgi:hypothetical protein